MALYLNGIFSLYAQLSSLTLIGLYGGGQQSQRRGVLGDRRSLGDQSTSGGRESIALTRFVVAAAKVAADDDDEDEDEGVASLVGGGTVAGA